MKYDQCCTHLRAKVVTLQPSRFTIEHNTLTRKPFSYLRIASLLNATIKQTKQKKFLLSPHGSRTHHDQL
jgi:hypothetical protein